MDNKNVFANNLRKQMELKGVSRNDICKALEISYFTVSDWVNGKKYPRMDKVEKLAAFFNIPKSELIEERKVIYIEENCTVDDENPHELRMLDAFERLSIDDQILWAQATEDFSNKKISLDNISITEGEKTLIKLFRRIPEGQQQVFLEMGRVFANNLKKD